MEALLIPTDEELEAQALDEIRLTDVGNARRLAALHGDKVRWCPHVGFFYYNGRYWERCDENVILGLSKDVPIALLNEAANTEHDGKRHLLAKHAVESEDARSLRATVALLKSEPGIPISTNDLDKDDWLLNVSNGTLCLRSGKLYPHSPRDHMTMIAGCDYVPDATAPLWERFVSDVMMGDEDLIGFVRRFCGYVLTGCTYEQCFAFLSGGGSNGKGVLTETLSALMGSYSSPISQNAIMVKAGDSIPHEWAGLRGKRLVYAGEVESTKTIDSALLKTLTGEDTMSVRFLRREFFEMKPSFKLLYSANGRPKVKDNSYGFWRRVRLIPFDETFPKGDPRRDPYLKDRLRGELPGILNWCLQGLKDWTAQGLGEPERVMEATSEYRDSENVVKAFCDEQIKRVDGHNVLFATAHERFIEWSRSSGERRVGRNTFASELRALGYEVERRFAGMSVLDVALTREGD